MLSTRPRCGIWKVLGKASIHISNNALFFPTPGSAAHARGSVGMAFRFNPKGGEMVGYATAETFKGPYTAVSTLAAVAPSGSEDPFVFELAGTLHMLWHRSTHGYHGWSADGGLTWESNALKGVEIYTMTVASAGPDPRRLPGGRRGANHTAVSTTFKRRERPELLFTSPPDSAGAAFPTHLLTGVQEMGVGGGDGTAFSHIQRLGGKG
jgi:hypothetical protein